MLKRMGPYLAIDSKPLGLNIWIMLQRDESGRAVIDTTRYACWQSSQVRLSGCERRTKGYCMNVLYEQLADGELGIKKTFCVCQ